MPKSYIIYLLLSLNTILFSKNLPIYFIGTFNENNEMLNKNFVQYYGSGEKENWKLTKYTEKLLKNDFSSFTNQNAINLMTRKDFKDNIKSIFESGNGSARDRRVGFFNLESSQRFIKYRDEIIVEVTMNLTFIQIGEESNRITQDNSFEIRYSSGIVNISRVNYNQKALDGVYRDSYKSALKKLLTNIQNDIAKKDSVDGNSMNDIFYTIKSFKLGKKSKDIISKIFKNDEKAKKFLMVIFQQALIKELRKDKSLDNIVLLYPSSLNKIIWGNWKSYLAELKKVTGGYKDNDAQLIIRDIKPVCIVKNKKGRTRYFDGYHIKALLGKLDDATMKKEKKASAKAIVATTYSQVVIPINESKNIDGLNNLTNKIKKINLNISQDTIGYLQGGDLTKTRNSIVIKAIYNSIEKLAKDTVYDMKKINSHRVENFDFKLNHLCKEY